MAERIRSTICETAFETKKGSVNITTSVGVSQYTDLLTKPNDFIESVDKSLYKAKQGGRNRVHIYSQDD